MGGLKGPCLNENYLLKELGMAAILRREYGIEAEKVKAHGRIFRIFAKEGSFGLKLIDYPLEDFLYIHSAMEHAAKSGFDRLGGFMVNGSGQPYLTTPAGNFFVCRWIEGKECDYQRLGELTAATIALAEFHLATKGFKPKPDCQFRSNWGKWPDNLKERAGHLLEFKARIKEKKIWSKFDQLFVQEVDYFYEEAQESLHMLAESPYWELVKAGEKDGGFCHHDMAYHNVIIQKKLAYLIDFDYSMGDLRIHDLASLILRNLKKCNWDIRRTEFILEKYNLVSTVTSQEIAVMKALMQFPQDFWQYSFTYYAEDIGRTENESLKRIERAVRMKKNRAAFLRDFDS
ncbi:MAG: CotS family spore coat protein [Clostridia bacterium]|nr:CotS family spore coat protein [Clostridia bacterium]